MLSGQEISKLKHDPIIVPATGFKVYSMNSKVDKEGGNYFLLSPCNMQIADMRSNILYNYVKNALICGRKVWGLLTTMLNKNPEKLNLRGGRISL